jgi:hypothetical protein
MPPGSPSSTHCKALHKDLCFQRAFPQSLRQWREASGRLDRFHDILPDLPATRRAELADSGIAGTAVHYRFSFDVARWLAKKAPGRVSIDWAELEDTAALDELLRRLLQPAEEDWFCSGYVTTRGWIDAARSGCEGTDFDWLLAQLDDRNARPFLRELYDTADIPLVWELGGSSYSKSLNVLPVNRLRTRDGFRPRPRQVRKEIQRPMERISRLPRARGSRLVDVAMASLAARHRETYHFNFANPEEVYLADVGEGIAIAVFGLLPAYRFALECTMGYLILSNGVPIGYGGASLLFKQVNTGINIFAEYRGSEASCLWVQVMRVYHALIGCTRFIVNAYQLGGENREALRSGAFWFYYRLGYRPMDAAIRRLAKQEDARRKRNPGYRSPAGILKRLARSDMQLALPGSRPSEAFDEAWLASGSNLATRALASTCETTRIAAADRVASELARSIGIPSLRNWTGAETSALRAIAPYLAAVRPSDWSVDAKRLLRKTLRAKGGQRELLYARLMAKNDLLLRALRKACISVG